MIVIKTFFYTVLNRKITNHDFLENGSLYSDTDENLGPRDVCGRQMGTFDLESSSVWGHSVLFSENWALSQKGLS